MTGSHEPQPSLELLRQAVGEVQLGERGTLVQFSSVFCAPCRAMRLLLHDIAEVVPGLAHFEVDADRNPDLAFEWQIAATPTVVILGPAGTELGRASGVTTRAQILATLAGVLPSAEGR